MELGSQTTLRGVHCCMRFEFIYLTYSNICGALERSVLVVPRLRCNGDVSSLYLRYAASTPLGRFSVWM
jgi:hypothetical protein